MKRIYEAAVCKMMTTFEYKNYNKQYFPKKRSKPNQIYTFNCHRSFVPVNQIIWKYYTKRYTSQKYSNSITIHAWNDHQWVTMEVKNVVHYPACVRLCRLKLVHLGRFRLCKSFGWKFKGNSTWNSAFFSQVSQDLIQWKW